MVKIKYDVIILIRFLKTLNKLYFSCYMLLLYLLLQLNDRGLPLQHNKNHTGLLQFCFNESDLL